MGYQSQYRARKGSSGFTLLEIMVAIVIFGVILVMVGWILQKGFTSVALANGRRDAENSLNKAYFWLKRDLEGAAPSKIGHKRTSVAGGGDAVWFLSASDPANPDRDTNFSRSSNGAPRWQNQILYYLVRPADYAEVSGGFSPAIDPDALGDYYAPHKFLIRKVIRTAATGDEETLLSPSEIDAYATQPVNYSLSTFAGQTNVLDYKLIADKLLSFNVDVVDRTVEFEIAAVRLNEAGRTLNIGNVSLKDHPQTQLRRARLLLRN